MWTNLVKTTMTKISHFPIQKFCSLRTTSRTKVIKKTVLLNNITCNGYSNIIHYSFKTILTLITDYNWDNRCLLTYICNQIIFRYHYNMYGLKSYSTTLTYTVLTNKWASILIVYALDPLCTNEVLLLV